MTYGYEEPVIMPTMSVYDTSLAQAYIAGLREQYNQQKEDMKEFMKQYQDFRSDIAGANEEYHNETTGRINNALNLMISNGIDPLRSAEGRAAISRLIYTTNTKKLKDLEQQKENYDMYRKALAEGIANGTVDEKAENFFLEQQNLLRRDENGKIIPFTAMDGDQVRRWDRLAPTKYQSLHDLTATEFDKLQAEEMLQSDKPGYIKKGVSEASMDAATDASMRLLDNTPWGQFYRRQAEELAGPGASKEQVDAKLRQMIKDQNVKQPKYEVDQYKLEDYKTNNNIREHRANRITDLMYPTNGSGSNTGATSWTANYAKGFVTRMTERGSITISNGLRAMISKVKGGPSQAILAISQNIPESNLARFLNRKTNRTNGFVVTSHDFTEGNIMARATAMSRSYKNGDALRSKGKEALDTYRTTHIDAGETVYANCDKIAFVESSGGKYRVVFPITLSNYNGKSETTDNALWSPNNNFVWNTNITGTFADDGSFVPDSKSMEMWNQLDQRMTKEYATSKNQTNPMN